MTKGLFLLLLGFFLSSLTAFGQENEDSSNTQKGAVYSPTMGWVKTSSAGLNPVTDYHEAGYRQKAETAEKATAEIKKAKAFARKPYKKPRVLVA